MKRLLEGSGSEFERGLLDALQLERPSPELEQRMRDALGLGPVPAPAPVPSAAPAAAAKTFGGWGAVAAGTIAAALLVGGGIFVKSRLDANDAAPPSAPAKLTPPSTPVAPTPAPAVAAEPAPPVLDLNDVAAEDQSRARSTQGGSRAVQTPQSLREEIQLIDAARVAVKSNDADRALTLLDRYTRRFPDGAFKQEARVLRAEALKNRSSAPK